MSRLQICPILAQSFFHLEQAWIDSPKLRPLLLLAALVVVAASPVLCAGDAIRGAYRSWIRRVPSDDYHYFYSTELFASYLEQLEGFISNELEVHPNLASLDLVQWIFKPVQNKEACYRGIVNRLRNLVRKKANLPPETATFVEKLCHWIYTGTDLLTPMTHWMKGQMCERDQKNLHAPHRLIRDLHQRLQSDSRFQGDVFADYRPYDPQYLGDTPSRFFRVGDTQIIRTPAVTRDQKRSVFGHLTQARVVEEFQGFLQHCQKQRQTHLYVNLMARHGSEKARIEALEALEGKTPQVLQLLSLSKDCAFYRQEGVFQDQGDAPGFKETFLQQMFGANPGYRWPFSWDRAATRETCRQAIDRIHTKYFVSVPRLTREQRLAFIELAYTEIIETLLHQKKPATCNISCRSCVDRGAASLSLLYAKTQSLKEEASRVTLATIALAPALIAQSRPMLFFRMDRLYPSLEHIVKKEQ